MTLFRLFLLTAFLTIAIYSAVTAANHGWGLVPIFFGDIAKMTWPGQFNTDFFMFLLLSGTWVAWRNDFTPAAFGLSIFAVFGGMLFLSGYLLYLSVTTKGDIVAILLGNRRASNRQN